MIPKKYYFIPEQQLTSSDDGKKNEGFSVSITSKFGMYIGAFDVKMYNLDGKVVRLYADPSKKTLAWKEIKEGNLLDLEGVRVLNANKVNGNLLISVAKIIKTFGIDDSKFPIKNIPVKTYLDAGVDEPYNVVDLSSYVK